MGLCQLLTLISRTKKCGALRSRDGKRCDFKISVVCRELRDVFPHVEWNILVWFSNYIPKHSFILWLWRNWRLRTRCKCGTQMVLRCAFCDQLRNSADHLFLWTWFLSISFSYISKEESLDFQLSQLGGADFTCYTGMVRKVNLRHCK